MTGTPNPGPPDPETQGHGDNRPPQLHTTNDRQLIPRGHQHRADHGAGVKTVRPRLRLRALRLDPGLGPTRPKRRRGTARKRINNSIPMPDTGLPGPVPSGMTPAWARRAPTAGEEQQENGSTTQYPCQIPDCPAPSLQE